MPSAAADDAHGASASFNSRRGKSYTCFSPDNNSKIYNYNHTPTRGAIHGELMYANANLRRAFKLYATVIPEANTQFLLVGYNKTTSTFTPQPRILI